MPSEEILQRLNEQLRAETVDGIRNPRTTYEAPATWSAEYLDTPRVNHSTGIRATGYRHLRIDPLGSRGAPLDIWQLKGVVVLETGCFTGSLEQFEADAEAQHGDSIFGKEYAATLVFIRAWLAPGEPCEAPVLEEVHPLERVEPTLTVTGRDILHPEEREAKAWGLTEISN